MKRSFFMLTQSFAFLIVCATLSLLWNQPTALAAKYPIPKDHELNEYEQEVIKLVNAEREKHDLKPLVVYVDLSYIARTKSADMRDQDYFGHTSPTYGTFDQMIRDHGMTKYRKIAENICAGQDTPAEAVHDWMNSDGHRKNILDPKLTHIGVGYVEGGRYGTYWTQMFYGN